MQRQRLDFAAVAVAFVIVDKVADNHGWSPFCCSRPPQRGLDGDPQTARGSEAAGHATGRGITRTARSAAQEVRGYPVRGPWTEALGRNPEAPECAVGRASIERSEEHTSELQS